MIYRICFLLKKGGIEFYIKERPFLIINKGNGNM